MRLRGGKLLVRRRFEQILETRHAVFEDEIQFALFLIGQIVEEANDVFVVHFAQKFDLQAHIMLAVGNFSKLPLLYYFHGFTTKSHAICDVDRGRGGARMRREKSEADGSRM